MRTSNIVVDGNSVCPNCPLIPFLKRCCIVYSYIACLHRHINCINNTTPQWIHVWRKFQVYYMHGLIILAWFTATFKIKFNFVLHWPKFPFHFRDEDRRFSVVEFTSEGCNVSIVPSSWVLHSKKECLWPPLMRGSSVMDLVRACSEPGQGWKSYPANILARCSKWCFYVFGMSSSCSFISHTHKYLGSPGSAGCLSSSELRVKSATHFAGKSKFCFSVFWSDPFTKVQLSAPCVNIGVFNTFISILFARNWKGRLHWELSF